MPGSRFGFAVGVIKRVVVGVVRIMQDVLGSVG